MSKEKAKVPCDCLNDCGDDPWLKNGRSQPCENRLALQERERAVEDTAIKVAQLCTLFEVATMFELIDKLHTKLLETTNAALNQGNGSAGGYASAEECATVLRPATPDEKWLDEQLERIDPHRHEMGGSMIDALVKLVFEMRAMLTQKVAS